MASRIAEKRNSRPPFPFVHVVEKEKKKTYEPLIRRGGENGRETLWHQYVQPSSKKFLSPFSTRNHINHVQKKWLNPCSNTYPHQTTDHMKQPGHSQGPISCSDYGFLSRAQLSYKRRKTTTEALRVHDSLAEKK